MLAFQAIPLPSMLDAFRKLRADAGDDACARNILRFYVDALPEEEKKKINLQEWSKQHITKLLKEYTDLGTEKDNIIKRTLNGLVGPLNGKQYIMQCTLKGLVGLFKRKI